MAAPPVPAGASLALKEWGAVVHALLQGRQTVLLRKGGIHEKRFEVAGPGAVLFPTVAHSHAERTRPEHHDLLPLGEADATETQVVLRAAVEVVATVLVERPTGLAALEPAHVWTTASVQADRVDFRPRHRLAALVVAARPLAEPVVLPRREEFAGCRSWLDVPVSLPPLQEPVVDPDALQRVAERARSAVG